MKMISLCNNVIFHESNFFSHAEVQVMTISIKSTLSKYNSPPEKSRLGCRACINCANAAGWSFWTNSPPNATRFFSATTQNRNVLRPFRFGRDLHHRPKSLRRYRPPVKSIHNGALPTGK